MFLVHLSLIVAGGAVVGRTVAGGVALGALAVGSAVVEREAVVECGATPRGGIMAVGALTGEVVGGRRMAALAVGSSDSGVVEVN